MVFLVGEFASFRMDVRGGPIPKTNSPDGTESISLTEESMPGKVDVAFNLPELIFDKTLLITLKSVSLKVFSDRLIFPIIGASPGIEVNIEFGDELEFKSKPIGE